MNYSSGHNEVRRVTTSGSRLGPLLRESILEFAENINLNDSTSMSLAYENIKCIIFSLAYIMDNLFSVKCPIYVS